jgi:hypothetical protein
MLWADVLKSHDHVSAAARVLASLGLSLEQFTRSDDAMAAVVDLYQDPLPVSADAAGQLWIHCSCVGRLIERVSDTGFLDQMLHDELAQVESWAEYVASRDDCAVMVPALQELQRQICLTHGIASRHITGVLMLITGTGTPLRQALTSAADCRFGYRDILETCRRARQIVPGKKLLSDRAARIYGLEPVRSDSPLDPVAVLLNAGEYEPYVRTLPWYGYDVEPFLLPSGRTLGGVFERFDAPARARIVDDIERP